jgi:hypothetical protein
MVRSQMSAVDVRRGGADFFAKGSAFSGGVGSCIVSMDNEWPPINLREEQKKFCENINTVVLGIKCVACWKRVE